ncbi:TPA: ISLre2 family transposase [Streptococcus suis]|nr:ISLre2 family transposase [Streptococcus suis]HEM3626838.1 ISLre2 family transposase [Streptococcus suis]HEM3653539.1 ISLre2 family transposase [Streptococcus suis]HEM3656951.1 ISLre2 family transposase [Streptococcus suis]HEM3700467.1 ISLre2 family transposase [Streptococcus suis]
MIDERELKQQLLENTNKDFLSWVKTYDESLVSSMQQRGYTCIHSMERTVAFTFGEFTFRRRRWKKGDSWIVPVDEKLGLEKNTRYSKEFMYQVAKLSTMMSYDKVVRVIEMTYHIVITKPTVVKAVKLCADLLEEQKDYQSYQEDNITKEKVDIIYVEGDGVMVKTSEKALENRRIDLSHFVVHTGSQKVGNNRFELQNKKEFVSLSNRQARDQVLDYLYHHFEINEDTLLITNSDGGHGYTPYVFKEMAKALKVGRHEHFWDEYHLNQKLQTFFKPYPAELLDKAFQAIQEHDKSLLRTVLDTTEGFIEAEEEWEQFDNFKRKLLQNFQYTKPAKLRGFSHSGIGIMESQHRKITYRMKKGGKYWTIRGADAMSQMILLADKDELRDLMLGSWREDYHKIQSLNGLSGGEIKRLESKKSSQSMPTGRITWKQFKP